MRVFDTMSSHAHWVLRLALAGVFIYHGIGKFMMLAPMSEMLNLPLPVVALVGFAEVAGGTLILIGGAFDGFWGDLATRLGALALIPVMIGAIAMVHWGQWSFVASATHPMGGMEFQVTLLLLQVYLLIKGNHVKVGVAVEEEGHRPAHHPAASYSK